MSFTELPLRIPGLCETPQEYTRTHNRQIVEYFRSRLSNTLEIAKFLWWVDGFRLRQVVICSASVSLSEDCDVSIEHTKIADKWEENPEWIKDRYIITARCIQAVLLPATGTEG